MMHLPKAAGRNRFWLGVAILLLFCSGAVEAAEVQWTGNVSTLWSQAANWEPRAPGNDDIVRVPVTANQPVVDGDNVLCGGLVLEEGATLRVLAGSENALYIISAGDLDGDGKTDIEEREISLAIGNFDIDGDGLPNFADSDSDGDGLGDECEFAYEALPVPEESPEGESEGDGEGAAPNPCGFHAYYNDENAELDCDGDGVPNEEECAAGSDPTDPLSIPVATPVSGWPGAGVVALIILILAVCMLRPLAPRGRRVLRILILSVAIPAAVYLATEVVWAVTSVDFASRTLQAGVATTAPGSTVEINGASIKPWNGQSTYVNRPVKIRAQGGPAFLGGMRVRFTAGALGVGSVDVASAYATNHPAPVAQNIPFGSAAIEVFQGERVTLTAFPDSSWAFGYWTDDASGTANPTTFQVLTGGARATAVFGPPGPDLAATVESAPPNTLKAGGTLTAEIRVTNIGLTGTPESAWSDGFYLSRDAAWDAADLELQVTPHSGALAAGASYTSLLSTTLPDIAPGRYHLLGVADVDNEATDGLRANNTTAVSITVLDVNLAL